MNLEPAPVLHTGVAEVLGREIVDGVVPPGSALTLESLQERFGVSRTVAREVVRALEAMGLVSSKRRVGILVRPVQDWDVLDPTVITWRLLGPGRAAQLRSLTELRAAVEPFAAGWAARRASEEVRASFVPLAQEMRALGEAGRLHEFLALDQEFHDRLLRASGNEMFAALTDAVAAVLAGRTGLGLMPPQPVPEALDAHEAVARAIAAGDPAGAEAAMGRITSEVRAAFSHLAATSD
ncbi:FadR/GntR family transcriptional regulator [Kineococcus gynurae]|uniref:FadR/GntR family transcriptional regulator n=1 Tax=Kineococcus gynurae TaxID=452979 RepID=A0ABV5LRY4_9ACTN